MLSANDLAAMQTTVAESLPETATILSRQVSPDGQGGFTEQFVPSGACAARLVAGSALSKEQAARLSTDATHVILLTSGIDIATNDRIQVGVRLFQVLENAVAGTWDIVRRISAREI